MRDVNVVPIENDQNYQRDINTHAVININNTEYESYMRQKSIIENAKNEAKSQTVTINAMKNDIEILKNMIAQLIDKDSNGITTSPK